MEVVPVEIKYYQTISGKCPFLDWFDSLDCHTQVIVDKRLARIRVGLFGDYQFVGSGVFELRFDTGPGYRIYYAKNDRAIVLLLCAGDKKGQSADIRTAQAFWKEYLRRIDNETPS